MLRDRAFEYTIAYSDIRGAEILAYPDDEHRNGASWADLSIDDARPTALAKTQDPDDRALPAPIHDLDRYRHLWSPHDDWPLFPTMSRRVLYQTLRENGVDPGRVREETT